MPLRVQVRFQLKSVESLFGNTKLACPEVKFTDEYIFFVFLCKRIAYNNNDKGEMEI